MSKSETRKDLSYVDQFGMALTATSIIDSEVEDDIIAITSDDRVVSITHCFRLTTGAAGTGESARVSETVEFTECWPAQDGLFHTIKTGGQFIRDEVVRRQSQGKAFKRWSQIAWASLALMSESPDAYAEAKEEGIITYLSAI